MVSPVTIEIDADTSEISSLISELQGYRSTIPSEIIELFFVREIVKQFQ